MNSDVNDPVRSVTRSIDLRDLPELVGRPGPFLTLVIPSPSALDDARQRLDIRWGNARRGLADRWPDDRIADLDALIDDIGHEGGEAVVIIQPSEGPAFVEFLGEPVTRAAVHVDPLPRLATVIESRQRTLPHIVVDADRAGATIIAFDGGSVLARHDVEGETLHIHRGHPGGWSQRRFQQRAENRWEENADEVADAVIELATQVDPVLIAVAGEVRAQTLIADALDETHGDRVVKLEAGDADGIADEVVRHVSDHLARVLREIAERLRAGLAQDTAATGAATLDPLRDGRVEMLLVNDDDADEPLVDGGKLSAPEGSRAVDAAIDAALRSDADIVVMPGVAAMDGPLAALLRW